MSNKRIPPPNKIMLFNNLRTDETKKLQSDSNELNTNHSGANREWTKLRRRLRINRVPLSARSSTRSPGERLPTANFSTDTAGVQCSECRL